MLLKAKIVLKTYKAKQIILGYSDFIAILFNCVIKTRLI